ncbi:MAG: dual specificity protein phosphatase family protein [Nitrososphaeraceae archaeon]|nr:dual specificity protein phosphatase family protein [Nitrososphaeraceae archaeon]
MTLIGNLFRWIHGKVSNKPTNFSWVIDNKLAGSGTPMTSEQYRWLIKNNIKSIVTVREFPLPQKWLVDNEKEETIINDYKFVYVKDYGVPPLEVLDNIVDYINIKITKEKKPLVVHCAAGKGRTGTILAAYLLKQDNISSQDAIKKIRSLRPGSIQSKIQEEILHEYETFLKGI